jgi:hypothetical protein
VDATLDEHRPNTVLSRTLCALVALAAGVVGILMLISPESTGRYFSWALGPAALASLVGAFYVASGLVFGWAAARERWPGQRGLCLAVFGLTLPTLAATARHQDVFDFSRWQAVGWVILFIASPLLFGLAIYLARGPVVARGPELPPGARRVLAATAVVYGALAITLWTVPGTVSDHGPFAAGPMGVRFAGAWAAFLCILAAFAAVRPTWEESRVPLFALAAWPVAGLVAAALRFDDLRSGAPGVLYVAGLGVLAVVGIGVLVARLAVAGERRPAPVRHGVAAYEAGSA